MTPVPGTASAVKQTNPLMKNRMDKATKSSLKQTQPPRKKKKPSNNLYRHVHATDMHMAASRFTELWLSFHNHMLFLCAERTLVDDRQRQSRNRNAFSRRFLNNVGLPDLRAASGM